MGNDRGILVPSFEGYCKHPNRLQRQMVWFSHDHVIHCYVVERNIDPKPMPTLQNMAS